MCCTSFSGATYCHAISAPQFLSIRTSVRVCWRISWRATRIWNMNSYCVFGFRTVEHEESGITLTADAQQRLAVGHNSQLMPVPTLTGTGIPGVGALKSTTNNLLDFLGAHLGYTTSKLAQATASMQSIRRPIGPNREIGLGWLTIIRTPSGKEIIAHNGGTGGHRSSSGSMSRAGLESWFLQTQHQGRDLTTLKVTFWTPPPHYSLPIRRFFRCPDSVRKPKSTRSCSISTRGFTLFHRPRRSRLLEEVNRFLLRCLDRESSRSFLRRSETSSIRSRTPRSRLKPTARDKSLVWCFHENGRDQRAARSNAPTAPAQTAQATRPQFEAASIRRDLSDQATGFGARGPGRYLATNTSLEFLIMSAYEIKEFQIAGAPAWIKDERYVIEATTDRSKTPEEIGQMLQTLLEERFGLKVHREMKESPVYFLQPRVAKNPLTLKADTCSSIDTKAPPVFGPATKRICGSLGVGRTF